MEKFTQFIVKNNKIIILIFLIITVICGILAVGVKVNYNLEDYLPKDSNSTIGLNIMKEEFDEDFPSANVMLDDVSIQQALACKEKLKNIPHVTSVTWLDDVVGIDVLLSTPFEYIDNTTTEAYYKDNNALISLAIEPGYELDTVNELHKIIGEENALSGSSVNKAVLQEMSSSETLKAMLILVPLIILILLLTTSSYIEPVIYLVSIGIAILINMGTNIFFSDISFITKTVSPILQLAVSLDYAIFLMHSFKEYRTDHEPKEAMKMAIKKSISSISGSAATTIIGFLALIFMRFGIGMDLGLNLVKGVALSFISIMIFMPALT
ncbi:MAG TPA: MMPL family transporter, partial [Clostridia bacterium]|nr:MMPL family transporter [Clostridia bacterium]